MALRVALGAVVALGATGVLKSLLFGVNAFDALTFIAMSGVMLVVALVASYVPAGRRRWTRCRRSEGSSPCVSVGAGTQKGSVTTRLRWTIAVEIGCGPQ